MTQHTPTPWESDGDEIIAADGDDSPWRIAICASAAPNSDDGSGNAEFIVTAVNSHDELKAQRDELLEALEQAALELEEASKILQPLRPGCADIFETAAKQKRELIASARGPA